MSKIGGLFDIVRFGNVLSCLRVCTCAIDSYCVCQTLNYLGIVHLLKLNKNSKAFN